MATGMVDQLNMWIWIVNGILTVYAYDFYDGKCDTIQSDPNYRRTEAHNKWFKDHAYRLVARTFIDFDVQFGKWAKIAKWYYYTFNVKYLEKFPLSSTLLVWRTDPWHMYKMIKSRLIDVQITLAFIMCFPIYWKWFLLLPIALFIARSIGFHKTFRK